MPTNRRRHRKVCVAALVPLAASLAGAESQPPSSRGPVAQVTGQALTANGKAAGSRLYSVIDVRETTGNRGPQREFASASGQTDPHGRFSFEVPSGGLHRLTVWVAKGGWARRETPIAGDTNLGALRLDPGVTVSGVVVNVLTGEPVPSVKVRVTTPPGPLQVPVGELASLLVAGQRISDESGRFRLNLPEGDHTFGVVGGEWILDTDVPLHCRKGDALNDLHVPVTPAPVVRGLVRGADGVAPVAGTPVRLDFTMSSGCRQWRADTCVAEVQADGSFVARTRALGAAQVWAFVAGHGNSAGQPVLLAPGGTAELSLEVGRRPFAWDFATGIGPVTLFSESYPVEVELQARTGRKDDRCLRVACRPDQAAPNGLALGPTPFWLGEDWILALDYRVPPSVPVNVYVTSGRLGLWYEIGFAAPREDAPVPVLGRIADVVCDAEWHRAQFHLSASLRKNETLWTQIQESGCFLALASPRREDAPSAALPAREWTFWLDNLYVGPP